MMRAMTSLVNRNAVAAGGRSRGFSCDLWVDQPGQVWPDFVHGTDEVVMVLDGEVEFEVAGVTHRPRIGEEILIPAGALHTVRNRGTTKSRWLYGYRRERNWGR